MNRTPSRAVLVAIFWCVLAAWQSARSFARCGTPSGWGALFWAIHLTLLAAPLMAVIRLRNAQTGQAGGFDVALAIALLTYVPMMIAMQLVEICASAR